MSKSYYDRGSFPGSLFYFCLQPGLQVLYHVNLDSMTSFYPGLQVPSLPPGLCVSLSPACATWPHLSSLGYTPSFPAEAAWLPPCHLTIVTCCSLSTLCFHWPHLDAFDCCLLSFTWALPTYSSKLNSGVTSFRKFSLKFFHPSHQLVLLLILHAPRIHG